MAADTPRPDPSQNDAIARGRQELIAWRSAFPKDFYAANSALRALVARHAPAADLAGLHGRLHAFGQAMGGAEGLVLRADQPATGPVLERWDALGRRQERVRFDGAYHEVGRLIYGSGVMGLTGQKGRGVEQAVLIYLASHHGEAGHVCPLACTAGMIKAIQRVGHPGLQKALLPLLTDPAYATRLHASQFLTEVQGGSDVGANATRAVPVAPESAEVPATWAIHGEKWFCSVIDAPLYLMTARPEGAPQGTRGLGLFVVPHDLPPRDRVEQPALSHLPGNPPSPVNHFAIRRLKNKLGTRAMASGEVDWHGALAWQLGPLDKGFYNVIEIVLNTSRLLNALACAGMMYRAFLEASTFARHRGAFGQPIARYALVDGQVAQIYAEAVAAIASTLDLIALEDDGSQPEALRLGLNLNKYWTSVRNTQMVRLAMEVLGGNGTIEDFSPLPRLYRDAMVTESWEGTHNVLAAQTHRDMAKLRLHEAWLGWIGGRLTGLKGPLVEGLQARHQALATEAARLASSGTDSEGPALRAWMDQAMVLHQGMALTELAETGGLPREVAECFLGHHPLRTFQPVRGWWPGV